MAVEFSPLSLRTRVDLKQEEKNSARFFVSKPMR